MDNMLEGLRNWFTTACGVILGAANYLATIGLHWPATREDVGHSIVTLAAAMLGIRAQDAFKRRS